MSLRKKFATVARIEEASCIGCAKCLMACPVDAIIGAPKQLHTVIEEECIGCELCLPPCPVDCIQIVPYDLIEDSKEKTKRARERYHSRKQRLMSGKEEERQIYLKTQKLEKKSVIQQAIERFRAKH